MTDPARANFAKRLSDFPRLNVMAFILSAIGASIMTLNVRLQGHRVHGKGRIGLGTKLFVTYWLSSN